VLESTAKALRSDEFPLFRVVSFPVQAVLVGEHAVCWLVNMRLLLAPYSEYARTEAKLACCPDRLLPYALLFSLYGTKRRMSIK